jgi:hypothetical protein
MILPTKGIAPPQALISLGADILRLLSETKTVSRLWDDFKRQGEHTVAVTFDWFVLSLDLLFVLGAVDFDRGRVRRATSAATEGS